MPSRSESLERRLEGASTEVKIAIMAVEIVHIREDLDEMKDGQKWVSRSLFGLALTIIAGILIFYATQGPR